MDTPADGRAAVHRAVDGGADFAKVYSFLSPAVYARLRLLGTMHEAGVGIVAGTDAGFPYIFPGTSLHRELELLVTAGLPPMAALQTATRNAAGCCLH